MKCRHGVLGPCAICKGKEEMYKNVRESSERLNQLESKVAVLDGLVRILMRKVYNND